MTNDPHAYLEELARASSLLVALDFDGVLAPLQDDPEASRPVARSAAALARLASMPGCAAALISGRDLDGLRRVASPPPGTMLVGSHGAEMDLGTQATGQGPSAAEQATLDALDRVRDGLRAQSAAPWWVEVKPLSRVFHSRTLPPEQTVWLHEQLDRLTADLPVRQVHGHDIVEFAVRHATKGTGLAAVLDAVRPTAAIYMGDDVTDEDAFAELHTHIPDISPALAVKVGPGSTAADFRLADPQAVAGFLTELAAARSAHVAG